MTSEMEDKLRYYILKTTEHINLKEKDENHYYSDFADEVYSTFDGTGIDVSSCIDVAIKASGRKSVKRCNLKGLLNKLELALASEEEEIASEKTIRENPKKQNYTLDQLLENDISECEAYLEKDNDVNWGRKIYLRITARYDSVIKDLGHGLYAYYPDNNFYDSDVSKESIDHNLNKLLQRMIIFRATADKSTKEITSNTKSPNNKVFVVHGHDSVVKGTVAALLKKIGLEPIILHEQANGGKTIIEKIEKYSDVGFAVVLYTPCDLGRATAENVEQEKYRARQNVVFEHGYLIGKLGRDRVSAIVKGDIETPGDISGVVYIKMDDTGEWKTTLAKDMKDAGMALDLNKALE